ncbi:MAG: hypothetical protein RPR97_19145 [Colwellia sp.]|jgi:hypothetical protein
MERGVKDEGFVRGAFNIVDGEDGRWIAHQDYFNGYDSDELALAVRAALVTATNIYAQKDKLPESAVEEALNVQTRGEARAFIDKYSENI